MTLNIVKYANMSVIVFVKIILSYLYSMASIGSVLAEGVFNILCTTVLVTLMIMNFFLCVSVCCMRYSNIL